MQYLLIAHDYKDDKALERRMAVREKHIALGNALRDEGKLLYGVAMLDDQQKMKGSVYICEFASREELDQWLKTEPYVVSKVWEDIQITPCKVGPTFSAIKNQLL